MSPLLSLRGIGPHRAELLARKGFHTVSDLLYFLPIRYEDRTRVFSIGEAKVGMRALVQGRVRYGGEAVFPRSGKRFFRIVMDDGTGRLELIWFRYRRAHLEGLARPGTDILAYGQVHGSGDRKQVAHPDVSVCPGPGGAGPLGFHPVYSEVRGLSGNVVRTMVQAAVAASEGLVDPVPREITEALGLPGLKEAIGGVHSPPMGSSLELLNRFASPFHRRLVFDRFLSVMLGLSAGARSRKARPARAFRFPEEFLGRITAHLPYPLTRDQESAVRDILSDLSSGRAMNRLLQGDVGCGKTLVAACAISAVTAAGHQAALMVPSQVLAAQHYEHFKGLPSAMELRPVLLTGGLKGAERRAVLKRIADGESNVVIGTHALIQEGVAFRRLSLAVIDEQHRFGVRQRALLDHKGDPLHLLVMTATPIPRTLAMTAYADLEISVIREYPRGRRPVETHLVGEDRKRWAFMEVTESLKAGGQVMVVCQLVEESEDSELKAATEMHERVSKVFSPPYRVGLIHGRLSSEEKERVMGSFREGRIHILVGTTVVEVGIDAPGAKVMVIEQPERLGLAQLHQLRGRVGRKGEGGLCLLMVSGQTPPSAMARLKAFAACQDGFRIAEMDLEMRGQGELMGLRQAGAGELDLAEVLREPELLKAAREAAEKLLIEDPDLSRPEHLPLRRMLGRGPARALPA